jgi:hypothetical protein
MGTAARGARVRSWLLLDTRITTMQSYEGRFGRIMPAMEFAFNRPKLG